MSQETRLDWIEPEHAKLPLTRQCELAGVPGATVYRRIDAASGQEREDEDDLKLRALILLRGVTVTRPNQVWSTDLTYIRLARGFAYLVAVIDWYSRKVLSWRISNSMDASFCVDCLEDALRHHGRPEVFNSDQGSQFTSTAFTDVLKREGVTISMDGRGRALDNIFVERLWRSVKYEDVYLKGYANMAELTVGLAQYFALYNAERPHQALGYQTPNHVYSTGVGGGALIVDRFGDDDEMPQEKSNTGQRRAADEVEIGTA